MRKRWRQVSSWKRIIIDSNISKDSFLIGDQRVLLRVAADMYRCLP